MSDDNYYLFKRLVQVGKMKHLYEPGERPPYPIIIESPFFRDVIANMRLPEYMPFFYSIPFGAVLGYAMTANLKSFPLNRRRAFTIVWTTTMFFGWYIGFKGSYYKLMGFEDNGLKWKFSDEKVKKYVFTENMHGFLEDALKRKDIDSSRAY
ncbi:unnamed protein product [Blepharisma stoltei]|uniref:NADH-ubiquinone oxidoreductase 21kDa subunit N-terminal domain-containing protein n=1 Tax=Blepharisma stoltei TaxID=1481888 RepID=A0AAU9J2S8_9CILI|nr:unnamed protein product [Blepharisma stoltei]